jgi:hypothetical protein
VSAGNRHLADERKGGREAPGRKDGGQVAGPQEIRSLPVGGDEGAISLLESPADLPRGCVDERGLRLLRAVGPLVRLLLVA